MRQALLFFLVGVVLPFVTSLVTYTFISMGNDPLTLDETGALIMIIGLIKVALLGGTGVFPIDINKLFDNIVTRGKRSITSGFVYDNNTLYQTPEVHEMPCIRRFLCQLETAAKTSENYLPKAPNSTEGRIIEEEVAPEEVDPISEMQIEAIRALFGEDDPTGELSHRGKRAVQAVEGLTGATCEDAYRLCPGRFTVPTLYKAIFDEMNLSIHSRY